MWVNVGVAVWRRERQGVLPSKQPLSRQLIWLRRHLSRLRNIQQWPKFWLLCPYHPRFASLSLRRHNPCLGLHDSSRPFLPLPRLVALHPRNVSRVNATELRVDAIFRLVLMLFNPVIILFSQRSSYGKHNFFIKLIFLNFYSALFLSLFSVLF